jgi:hypothetical protein
VRERGSDDPRNGLILCATHHRAFDAHLFVIDPATLGVDTRPGYDRFALNITRDSIAHLKRKPHVAALQWRHARFVTALRAT